MDIIGKRKIWFIGSSIFIGLGLVMILLGGLKLGLDFTGGSIMEVSNIQDTFKAEELLKTSGINVVSVEKTGDNSVRIKTGVLSEEDHKKALSMLSSAVVSGKQVEETQYSTIGPTISKSITQKAYLSITLGLLVIILYVAWSFRKASSHFASWKYGICAALAMFHDVLFITGFFALLGYFFNVEIDSLFVTALLTVISFSVHDTIVIFDRIRENLKRDDNDFEQIVNRSVTEMISRSINTSLVVMFVIIALFLFGGESIKYFVLTLLVGTIIGTYSSVYIASPLLVVWNNFDNRPKKKEK